MITKRERLQKQVKYLRNRVLHGAGQARPVLLFGEQRSGTNMLLDCFRSSMRTAVYNETDDDAFIEYELRGLHDIRALVRNSPASHVVFKPTADGNRASEILDALDGSRGIWIYRQYLDAVSSALALFQETSLQYLQKVADRSPEARWRARYLSPADLEMIGGYLSGGLSEASARALIWYLRNSFYFRLGLDRRSDVMLINYEELVRRPVDVVSRVFDFVGLPFKKKYVSRVFASSVGRRPAPEIDARIATQCSSLMNRFNQGSA